MKKTILMIMFIATLFLSGCAIPESILKAENKAFTKMNDIAVEAEEIITDLIIQYRELSHTKIKSEVTKGRNWTDPDSITAEEQTEIQKRIEVFEKDLAKYVEKLNSLKDKWAAVFEFRKKVIDFLEDNK